MQLPVSAALPDATCILDSDEHMAQLKDAPPRRLRGPGSVLCDNMQLLAELQALHEQHCAAQPPPPQQQQQQLQTLQLSTLQEQLQQLQEQQQQQQQTDVQPQADVLQPARSSSFDPHLAVNSSCSSQFNAAAAAAGLRQLNSQAQLAAPALAKQQQQQQQQPRPSSRNRHSAAAAAAGRSRSLDAPGAEPTKNGRSRLCSLSFSGPLRQLGSFIAESLRPASVTSATGAATGAAAGATGSGKRRSDILRPSSSFRRSSSAGSISEGGLAPATSTPLCPDCGSSRCIIDVGRLTRLASPAPAAVAAAGSCSRSNSSTSSSGTTARSRLVAGVRGGSSGGCKPRPTWAVQPPPSCAVPAPAPALQLSRAPSPALPLQLQLVRQNTSDALPPLPPRRQQQHQQQQQLQGEQQRRRRRRRQQLQLPPKGSLFGLRQVSRSSPDLPSLTRASRDSGVS